MCSDILNGIWRKKKKSRLTSSSLLAVFTESIDCDNWWDCIGFCPSWPTWSMLLLLFGVVVDGLDVTGECGLLDVEMATTEFEAWLDATDVAVIKPVGELIDFVGYGWSWCWCWLTTIELLRKFGTTCAPAAAAAAATAEDDEIIDLICDNAAEDWRLGKMVWGWNCAMGWAWGCEKFATAAAAAACDWGVNK